MRIMNEQAFEPYRIAAIYSSLLPVPYAGNNRYIWTEKNFMKSNNILALAEIKVLLLGLLGYAVITILISLLGRLEKLSKIFLINFK